MKVSILIVSLFLTSFYTPATMNVALMGHWSFDDDDLTRDHSAFKSHGQLFGNPKQAKGVVGNGCLELSGGGDYLEIRKNNQAPIQFHDLNVGSISIWFKARTIPKDTSISPLFHYGNSTGCEKMPDASNEGLVLEIGHGKIRQESQGLYFTVFDNSCELPTFCFDTHSEPHLEDEKGLIEEHTWYHFVVVVGEYFNTGYLNGEEIDYRYYNFSDATASLFFGGAVSHDRMWIGKGFWDFAKETYFDGYIDDVRIYDIPLNESQIKTLYDMRHSD